MTYVLLHEHSTGDEPSLDTLKTGELDRVGTLLLAMPSPSSDVYTIFGERVQEIDTVSLTVTGEY